MRWAPLVVSVVVAGCAGGVYREPVERVVLPGGLEVSWTVPAERAEGGEPLVLRFRAVGEGPVVLCRVLREDGSGKVLVRNPEPGRFRYDPKGDCILAEPEEGSPFSLSPAFRWYEMVLSPGAPAEVVQVGPRRGRGPVKVFLEYIALSYRRLAAAAYAPEQVDGAGLPVRFSRRDESALRRGSPRRLFLRTAYLPPAMRVPLEIPAAAPP